MTGRDSKQHGSRQQESTASPVDWRLAAGVARGNLPQDGTWSYEQIQAMAERLRGAVTIAAGHVAEVSGLEEQAHAPTVVLDRGGWVDAACGGLRELVSVVPDERSALNRALAPKLGALQVGLAMGYLSGKVLGQFDPFAPCGASGVGALYLVGPNIGVVGKQLRLPSEQFELWVCLHEVTHRVQFGAVSWLRSYFADQVFQLLSHPDQFQLGHLPQRLRAARSSPERGETTWVEMVASPEMRERLDRILALGALLEGHADWVMDEVGPTVLPEVATMRERFNRRRQSVSPLHRLVRGMLGMEAKMRQYSQGAAFVRHAVGQLGVTGFNEVWQHPDRLPSRSEIRNPDRWVARIRQE